MAVKLTGAEMRAMIEKDYVRKIIEVLFQKERKVGILVDLLTHCQALFEITEFPDFSTEAQLEWIKKHEMWIASGIQIDDGEVVFGTELIDFVLDFLTKSEISTIEKTEILVSLLRCACSFQSESVVEKILIYFDENLDFGDIKGNVDNTVMLTRICYNIRSCLDEIVDAACFGASFEIENHKIERSMKEKIMNFFSRIFAQFAQFAQFAPLESESQYKQIVIDQLFSKNIARLTKAITSTLHDDTGTAQDRKDNKAFVEMIISSLEQFQKLKNL